MTRKHPLPLGHEELELSTLKGIYPVAPFEVYEDENPLRPSRHESEAKSRDIDGDPNAVEKFYNRLILCLFAVCLLWLTSLQVCAAVVGLNIKVPSFTLVASSCNCAYQKVTEQRDYYAACARRQVERCTEQLDSEYIHQKMSLLSAQQSNQAFARSFDAIVVNCSNAVAMSKKAINAWSSTGVQYTIPYYPTCVGTEKQSVVSSLGDTTSSRTSVYAASLAYTQSSDSTIERLAEYSFALNTYNAAYLHNKTQQLQDLAQSVVLDVSAPHIQAINVSFAPVGRIVDQILACASLAPSNSTCTYPVTLTQVYNIQKGISELMLVKMHKYMDDIVAFFDMMSADIATAVDAANAFYDSVRGPRGIITWINANSGLGNLCGKSTPNFCSFSKESWMIYMGYLPYPPNLGAILAPGLLWEKVKGVEVGERLKLAALTAGLQREVSGWVRDVKQALQSADFTPRDYDPPQYPAAHNISQEPAVQAQRSSQFIDRVETILSKANGTSQEDLIGAAKRVNATDYLDLATASLSGYTLTWADFSTASVDIALLVESFLAVNSVLFLFDYLYRALQTVRLVNRFWRRGGVKLSRADLRSHKPDIAAGWFVCIDRCLQLLPYFSVQLALVGMLVVLVIWGFAALFVPEYQSYVSSCVHHTSNHTFVSRNLNSLAFNYASSDGNSVIAHGLSRYNAQSAKYCSNSAASSLQAYTAVVNQMYASNQTLTTVLEDARKLSACINLPTLDVAFYQACCGTDVYAAGLGGAYSSYAGPSVACVSSGFQCPTEDGNAETAYLPPGAYLANSVCSGDYLLSEDSAHILANTAGTTQEAAFDCQALHKCQVTCTGPDAALVGGLSRHCACMGEWYFNGVFLQALLSLLAYLLTNLSRMLVTKGMVQILWRELAPEIVEYTADCDARGGVLGNSALQRHQCGGAVDVEKCSDGEFSAALSVVIKQQTDAFERQGYMWIVLGLLLNAPWVVLIFVLRSNIAYEG